MKCHLYVIIELIFMLFFIVKSVTVYVYMLYKWIYIYCFYRATRAFQNLLYLYPNFSRCNEIHVRLGLMFKSASEHESSLKVIYTFCFPLSAARCVLLNFSVCAEYLLLVAICWLYAF